MFGDVSQARDLQHALRRFWQRFPLEQKGPPEAPSSHQWANKTGRSLSGLPTYSIGIRVHGVSDPDHLVRVLLFLE